MDLYLWTQRIYESATIYLLAPTLKLPPVDILAFNGKAGLSSPPLCGSVCLFDWNFRKRSAWSAWRRYHFKIPHSNVGGVTDHAGAYTVLLRNTTPPFPVPNSWWIPAPAAPLKQYLCPKRRGQIVTHAPPAAVVNAALKTIQLGKNVYSQFGLFPFLDLNARLHTTCVFAPNRWVLRGLSLSEIRAIVDLPTQSKLTRAMLKTLETPVKPLVSIVNGVFFAGGGEERF